MSALKDLGDLIVENKYTAIIVLSLFLGAMFCFITTRSCRTASKKKDDIKRDVDRAFKKKKNRKKKD